jgi:hypothetical protein
MRFILLSNPASFPKNHSFIAKITRLRSQVPIVNKVAPYFHANKKIVATLTETLKIKLKPNYKTT